MKGRAILLKLFQSLSFYDKSYKQIVNENLGIMRFIERVALAEQEVDSDEENSEHDGEMTSDTNLKV